MVRILSSRDLSANVSIGEIVDAVEQGYHALGKGEVTGSGPSHLTSSTTHTFLNGASAVSGSLGISVFAYTGGNKGKGVPQKVALYFDPADGGLRAIIEADWLSWIRTGSSSAVATKHMARPDASVVGIYGSGRQARSQLLAITATRAISKAHVYSPRRESRTEFAAAMSATTGIPVVAVDDGETLLDVADIICTATTSRQPVFDGSRIRPGTHINAIGQHYPDRRELDTETMRRGRVVVDDRASALAWYGELLIPIAEHAFGPDRIHASLGEVVTQAAVGRSSPDEVTVFLSGGISAEYLAAAAAAWRLAEERGLGIEIDLNP